MCVVSARCAASPWVSRLLRATRRQTGVWADHPICDRGRQLRPAVSIVEEESIALQIAACCDHQPRDLNDRIRDSRSTGSLAANV